MIIMQKDIDTAESLLESQAQRPFIPSFSLRVLVMRPWQKGSPITRELQGGLQFLL
jgi:hypothetical protein